MDIQHTTLLVIGGGPGGYITAIRAAQLGIATTLIKRVVCCMSMSAYSTNNVAGHSR